MIKNDKFDVIVVGGGHAGLEAAFIANKLNLNVALFSLNKNKLGLMPCNPSIGGPAKGIITREIDALGGIQAKIADEATIQIKMLNEGRGPAVQALRAQIDKNYYSELMLKNIKEKGITLFENKIIDLIIQDNKINGVVDFNNDKYFAKTVILTTGTYLKSYVLRGTEKYSSGPDNEESAIELSQKLKNYGFVLQRLKTGTPPRVKASSIDFSKVQKEKLELKPLSFSHTSNFKLDKQISCFLTYTNERTHKIVRDNMSKSSLYSGQISGVGPRYCPSIEDKIVRFSDKERHQVFYEPETKSGDVIYVQGMSTSLPKDVQLDMIRTLPGMNKAEIVKWGYAIEYDSINPIQLLPTLESKLIQNLYFAGQINGTSGYEEAAGQGIIAGINASLKILKRKPFILNRWDSYIGVLIDDLVTKGTNEPYRMLTSRAEYRLLLRNDNADIRLSKYAYKIGTITKQEYQRIKNKEKSINEKINTLKNSYLSSNSELANKYNITSGPSMYNLYSRQDIDSNDLNDGYVYHNELLTIIRLEGYIKKQNNMAKKMHRLEKLKIPIKINYSNVPNLATEAKQKLSTIRPITIGQASRISGINPSDIQMLMFYMESRKL